MASILAPASHFSLTSAHDLDRGQNLDHDSLPADFVLDSATAQIFAIGRATAKRERCNECNTEHYLSSDGKCHQNTTCSICRLQGHAAERCFKACRNSACPHVPKDHHRDSCAQALTTTNTHLAEQLKVTAANLRALQSFCHNKGLADLPPLKA